MAVIAYIVKLKTNWKTQIMLRNNKGKLQDKMTWNLEIWHLGKSHLNTHTFQNYLTDLPHQLKELVLCLKYL